VSVACFGETSNVQSLIVNINFEYTAEDAMNHIEWILKIIKCEGANWTKLAQDKDQWRALSNTRVALQALEKAQNA
jgi:hypothetical protein